MSCYHVKNINSSGQVVNKGNGGFRSLEMAANYMLNVIKDCRANRACQIRTVAIVSGDEVIITRSV